MKEVEELNVLLPECQRVFIGNGWGEDLFMLIVISAALVTARAC